MKSLKSGNSISKAEVLSISPHGVWLYVQGKEHLLSYDQFPWFKNAKVSEVYKVELLHGHYLRWEDLDVDLEIRSLENLEQYPLKSRF